MGNRFTFRDYTLTVEFTAGGIPRDAVTAAYAAVAALGWRVDPSTAVVHLHDSELGDRRFAVVCHEPARGGRCKLVDDHDGRCDPAVWPDDDPDGDPQ